jgi:hypothetical protein
VNRVRGRSCARWLLGAALGLAAACLLLAAVSALINRAAPALPAPDRLSAADLARAAEVEHLRRSLGAEVLPGWEAADIPLILFNDAYAFLIGLPDPPDGWRTVPAGNQQGGPWQRVDADAGLGLPYYRQPLTAGRSPQNYTTQVGAAYTANLMTLEWFRRALAEQFRADLPAPLRPVFPYQLIAKQFMPSGDRWVTMALHEATHAFQAQRAPARLAAAEGAVPAGEARYPWEQEAFRQDWQAELDLLAQALRAADEPQARALAGQFLAQRDARRQRARLDAALVDYERQREWAEGIAKYVEFEIYRLAATTPGYTPAADTAADSEFAGYRDYARHWRNEVDQTRRMAGNYGDGRFYYSGMAQAVLLDRLSPGWKARLFDEGVWLEDLLAAALQ